MPLAPIECLPVELLQPIFLASEYNLGLLQASDRVAAKLSSDYVYYPTTTYWLNDVVNRRDVRSAAQTYIFACKWMTWSLFKSWATKTYEQNGCLCGLTAEQGCFDPQWPPNFENATEMVLSRSHLPRIAFVKGRVPQKLLRGPWTQDKTEFLRFLLWLTSMTVDWNDSETRQVAIAGRLQAMREKNLDAVELFNHNRRLGRAADVPLVRFAVMEAGCNRSIVYDTMIMASTWGKNLSFDCEELDRWCEERSAAGDYRGDWLREQLEGLRSPTKSMAVSQRSHQGDSTSQTESATVELDDYSDDNRLVVREHKWNQVSISFIFRSADRPLSTKGRCFVLPLCE